MRRYLLLSGDFYYPSGWDDYMGNYDTVDEAKSKANGEWGTVVDLAGDEPRVVADGHRHTRAEPMMWNDYRGDEL